MPGHSVVLSLDIRLQKLVEDLYGKRRGALVALDPKTGEFTGFPVASGVKAGRSASPYGMAIAGDGGIWVALNAMDKLARVDPITGAMQEFDIPVKGAVPRKGGPDADGNVWMGLHGAGKVLKVDIKNNNK